MHCKIQPRIGKPTTKAALSRLPNFISEAVNPRTNATNKPILKLKIKLITQKWKISEHCPLCATTSPRCKTLLGSLGVAH